MLKRSILLFAAVTGTWVSSFGQATSTADRRFDFQAGGGFTLIRPDYSGYIKGFALYTTLDFSSHFGGEFVFHQGRSSNGNKIAERTYEIGPRYYRTYGRYKPYVKAMYGRGVFNFPYDEANLAYNLFAAGVGVDYALLDRVNLRADYEYQHWLSFQGSGLTPMLFTVGVAYHFPGRLERGQHY